MSTSIFTSTTAPGKIFRSRSELAEHYKSDWHKYNLKRREAGLPLLKEDDFQARWEAALALKKEKEAKAHSGTDHIKASKKKKKKGTNENSSSTENKNIAASQENPTIEPRQCLFDPHMSDSLEENVTYMEKKFGFFIPDRGTYILDLIL
jgi:pre-60S factor REI1